MALRAAREASGKTQAQVAKEIGITENAYQKYEYDQREPRARMAVRVARAVNSTVETIWGEELSEQQQFTTKTQKIKKN